MQQHLVVGYKVCTSYMQLQCILLPTLQNVGVKLLATFQLVKFLQNIALYNIIS